MMPCGKLKPPHSLFMPHLSLHAASVSPVQVTCQQPVSAGRGPEQEQEQAQQLALTFRSSLPQSLWANSHQ